jgi:hypothetical protein
MYQLNPAPVSVELVRSREIFPVSKTVPDRGEIRIT